MVDLPRPRAACLLVLLLLGGALAGCLGSDDPAPASGGDDATGGTDSTGQNLTRDGIRPSVEGFVLDESRAPPVGANVTIQNHDKSVAVDATGHYAFYGLDDNAVFVLIARAPGYHAKAQQFVAIDGKVIRLDFILTPRPTETPYNETIERAGLVSCQAVAGAGHDHGGDGTEFEQGCSGIAGMADSSAEQVIEVEVKPDVVGMVVEVHWDSIHFLSDFMMVTLETVGYGDLDKDFGSTIGPSVIKMEIPQGDVAKFYQEQGGTVRITVDVHFEDDDEQAVGAAFAYQQPFTVRVSNFYVTPQPRDFTAFPGGGTGDASA